MARNELDLAKAADIARIRSVASAVILAQFASEAWITRRFKMGTARAHAVLEVLEERGIVGPSLGPGRTRDVLVRAEERRSVLDAEFPYPTGDKPAPAEGEEPETAETPWRDLGGGHR